MRGDQAHPEGDDDEEHLEEHLKDEVGRKRHGQDANERGGRPDKDGGTDLTQRRGYPLVLVSGGILLSPSRDRAARPVPSSVVVSGSEWRISSDNSYKGNGFIEASSWKMPNAIIPDTVPH